ncbi:MAG: acetate kinase [Clostridia bacterium]|nr:acetate kinase [Clostridia bacterium]
MKILVVNCGSSSLKYQLIDMETEQVLCKGKCDRIGETGDGAIGRPFIEYKGKSGKKIKEEMPLPDHEAAFRAVVKYMTDPEEGVVSELSEISAIGHRIVNAGPFFFRTTLVNDEVMKKFQDFSIPYAPLHNPAALQGINACFKTMEGIPQALVFDTTFHQTMPKEAFMYGVPYDWYAKYGVRRYGAHGMSHQFVTEEAAKLMNIPQDKLNMISCHLGNGSSITAVRNGKCVDTSMGFTPLEGLVMGTRSGDIDPAVLEFVMDREGMDIHEMLKILNKKSGLLALSGKTGDVRDLRMLRDQGDERSALALKVLSYRIRKYIGAYMAVLGHVDCITFEGGIGEHNPDVIKAAIDGLEEFGIKYDDSHIDDEMYEGIVSTPDSKIKMFVIATNEEIVIAKETQDAVSNEYFISFDNKEVE